jgi:abortive infection bacteriophage resistance protein
MYLKPHRVYSDQLTLLKQRGLIVVDDAEAINVLCNLGYYRFSNYLYPFKDVVVLTDPSGSSIITESDDYKKDTTFSSVYDLYKFDEALRLLSLEALNKLEVCIRSQMAYHLGEIDPLAHMDSSKLLGHEANRPIRNTGASPRTMHNLWLEKYEKLQQSAYKNDEHVKKHLDEFGEPLPIFIAIEFFDFGQTSTLFKMLPHSTKNKVSNLYEVRNGSLFASWSTAMSYYRNLCAHHGRLWNRTFTIKPTLPKRVEVGGNIAHLENYPVTARIYPFLAIISYLMNYASPDTNWGSRVKELISNFPIQTGFSVEQSLGFPANWSNLPLWN